MGLETVVYINTLNPANPTGKDGQKDGDDHIRNIKTAILATFPNITGAVTPTNTEFNFVLGATSNIQTQLDDLFDAGFDGTIPVAGADSGKLLTNNGTVASWSLIGTAGQYLRVNDAGTALEAKTIPGNLLYLHKYFGGF